MVLPLNGASKGGGEGAKATAGARKYADTLALLVSAAT